jgi:hypothetical protein
LAPANKGTKAEREKRSKRRQTTRGQQRRRRREPTGPEGRRRGRGRKPKTNDRESKKADRHNGTKREENGGDDREGQSERKAGNGGVRACYWPVLHYYCREYRCYMAHFILQSLRHPAVCTGSHCNLWRHASPSHKHPSRLQSRSGGNKQRVRNRNDYCNECEPASR